MKPLDIVSRGDPSTNYSLENMTGWSVLGLGPLVSGVGTQEDLFTSFKKC